MESNDINSYLLAAHEILTSAGFTRMGGKLKAPRTSKDNMAYIYQHPTANADIWVSSARNWRMSKHDRTSSIWENYSSLSALKHCVQPAIDARFAA